MAGNPSKAKNAAARRTKIEEARRAEQARDRRNRIITITASTVIVVGMVAGGYLLFDAGEDKEKEDKAVKAGSVDGVQSWKKLGRTHVEKKVGYPMSPPVGGNHSAVWQNCNGDVYEKPIANENAVHALEHGAVWVTYTDKAAEKDIKTLSSRVKETPYSLMSPYADQTSPIVLNAWGAQLKVKTATDPRVDTFFTKYVQGEQTPEPGAACTDGKAT